ncbi:MAG: hypothetical protein ACM3YN_07005 [Parcubacteria group bacterium]
MEAELKRLVAAVEARSADAIAQVNTIEGMHGHQDWPESSMEYDSELASLEWRLRRLHLSLSLLLEKLGLPFMLQQYQDDLEPHKTKFQVIHHFPEDPEFIYSEPLLLMRRVYEALEPVLEPDLEDGYLGKMTLLEGILRQTAHIIADRGLEPTSEKDVRNAIYDTLKVVFPDTVKEMQIPQIVKNYRPDVGVKSLEAAIEFKYAISELELKAEIDGIYADMHGYSGSKDWRRFFAVFYTSAPILHQDRLEEQFRWANANLSWKPIIVHGAGTRKAKAKAKAKAGSKSDGEGPSKPRKNPRQ